MNNYHSWQSWFQHVTQYMEKQQQTIEALTKQIEELQSKEQPKTVIEKIEYHFDQLKIDTLEGTLQIGLTPNGMEGSDLGDLYSNPDENRDANPILHSLNHYMTSDVPQWLDQYIYDNELRVSQQHKEQILADVRRQLPARVQHYKEQQPELDSTTLVNKIQEEIRHSVAKYLDTNQGDDA